METLPLSSSGCRRRCIHAGASAQVMQGARLGRRGSRCVNSVLGATALPVAWSGTS